MKVFLDSDFSFRLTAAILVKTGLQAGDKLRQRDVDELLRQQERHRLKEKAYQLLAMRAHSERELQQKLTQKGFGRDLIESVMADLRNQRLLDDREFARGYARSRLLTKPMGVRLLRHELWQRGISDEVIGQTLREVYSEKNPEDIARELVTKRQPRYSHLENFQKKKRLGALLLRRGFEWDIVKQLVEEINDDKTSFNPAP